MVTVIGIAGGSGSGKSTLGERIELALGRSSCLLVSQDDYYHDLSHQSPESRAAANFDHPDSVDSELLAMHLAALRRGEAIESPSYDFARHIRLPEGGRVASRPVILVEGTLVFVWPQIVEQMDLKIFVEAPSDVRLARRVRRDIAERGRDVDSVLKQYLATVRPMHDRYAGPSEASADLVVPGWGDNRAVVEFLAAALNVRGG